MKQKKVSSNVDVEYSFILNLFFEVIDSIRYSKNYYNPDYKHLETKIKIKTTQEINKIAKISTEYFYSKLNKNRKMYDKNRSEVNKLKRKSLERAIDKLESEKN